MSDSVLFSAAPLSLKLFSETLERAHYEWEQRRFHLLELLDSKPLLLFGFGGKGQTLARHIQHVAGKTVSVFDTSPEKRAAAAAEGFNTLDHFTEEDATHWATILGACQSQFEQKAAVAQNAIYFQEAASVFLAPHLAHLTGDFEAFIPDHLSELHGVYVALHPTSQLRFLQVLCFRLSNDPMFLQGVRQLNTEMWLDIPASFKTREYSTFLDVGAFDGDTLRCFQRRFSCARGIAVEANTNLFDSIREVAVQYPKGVEIMPVAAWSSRTRLRFDEVRFGMIQVTESEDGQLEAATIDSYVDETVDCLKMDIEGAEAQALYGCAKLLANFRPDLAIAAYHRPADFVSLHEQISRLGYSSQDFEWHFGHYSDCLDDSIFYVLKKQTTNR